MGGRGGNGGGSFRATSPNTPGYGVSSANGEMKTVRLYHASFSDFEEFDYSKKQKRGSDLQGEGFYFTSDPKQARLFGDILYEVEVKYSTDRRTAKRTGREKDFQYDPKTGYWVIPPDRKKEKHQDYWKKKNRVNWCFDGEPVGGIVAVSSVGTQADKESKWLFLRGYEEMMKRLLPSWIIFYGRVPEECDWNVIRVKPHYDSIVERRKKRR